MGLTTRKPSNSPRTFHIGAAINWAEFHFAQFAFDLIAMIQGTYQPGRISSFHGIGSSFLELKRAVAKPHSPPTPGWRRPGTNFRQILASQNKFTLVFPNKWGVAHT